MSVAFIVIVPSGSETVLTFVPPAIVNVSPCVIVVAAVFVSALTLNYN